MKDFAKLAVSTATVALIVAGSAANAEGASHIDRIKQTETIRIGHPQGSVPFSFLGPDQKPMGYSVEICQDVAARIQKKLDLKALNIQYVTTTSATRLPLIGNGTIDLECGNTTNKQSRKELVAFSPTTFVAEVVLAAHKDSDVDVNDLSSFRGKTIAATQGGHTYKLVADISNQKGYDIKMTGGPDSARSFMMMESGRADGVVSDSGLAYAQVATSKSPDDFVLGTKPLELAPYGIVEPKDDPDFKKLVDTTIEEMMKDGTVAKLYTKYFMSPLPPKGVNLKLPMGDALKHAIAHPTDSSDPAAYVD